MQYVIYAVAMLSAVGCCIVAVCLRCDGCCECAYNAVTVSALAVSLAAENADAVGRCWRNVCRCCCWC